MLLLSMEHITKIYPNGLIANNDITFQVNQGEIHALSGENGAGKSTLMKVLFGEEQPEEGQILYKGRPIPLGNSDAAIKLGIGMVHQHFMLAPSLTVAESVVLGVEPGYPGWLDKKKAVRQTTELAEKYHFKIDPTEKICNLSVGDKQKVEILKALFRGAELLILDEPTAVLTPQETKELFRQMQELRDKGHTLIFITHKLREVKEICERITMLRGGRSVGTEQVSRISEEEISRMMVGRDVMLDIKKTKAKPQKTVLRVRNLELSCQPEKGKVSFDVRSGEILGIAGVEGNGQNELAYFISGLERYGNGSIQMKGIELRNLSVRKRRELGISHVSEDRIGWGCSIQASVLENLFSTRIHRKEYSRLLLLNQKKMKEEAEELIQEYQIKCSSREEPVKTLSGGNIQKVVAAREFGDKAGLVLANQPTRGIDVGATEFIRNRLVTLRDQGAAILLISADLNEILTVSDSILVLHDYSIAAYFEDASQVKEERMGEYMLGIRKMKEQQIGGVVHEKN